MTSLKTNPISAKQSDINRPDVIFFGNGALADAALPLLQNFCNIIFHARKKSDLETVKELKTKHPTAHGILASYGVIIKQDLLDLFEPEGILNLHPSLLPKYRGPSPIETAILNGDQEFGISIMKLAKEMDAGDLYYQNSLSEHEIFSLPKSSVLNSATPDYKTTIYQKLVESGVEWLTECLSCLPAPKPQRGEASYTQKFDTSMSPLDPKHKTALTLLHEIRAFSGFPKSKYTFFGHDCTIISAHIASSEEVRLLSTNNVRTLSIQCTNNSYLIIDQLQPAGRKIMDAKSFLNGYAR